MENIKGYGRLRNDCLELLMSEGFNGEEKCMRQYHRKSRMAIVTSVMTDNSSDTDKPVSPDQIRDFVKKLEEYKQLGLTEAYRKAIGETIDAKFEGTSNFQEISFLLAFARLNNLIFDVDSVLERGRGASCTLCVEDEQMKEKFQELQIIDKEVFGYDWGINTTYVGVACERPRRHLYVSYQGKIRPCIGATDVKLGNIKEVPLLRAWASAEMQIIRAKKYVGKCAEECANYIETDSRTGNPLCNSCLGRSTEDLTNTTLLDNGYVKTIGCWNFRERK
jgi:hypothetical protein